jgi:hypothetical protein
VFEQPDIEYTYFYLRDAACHTFPVQPDLFDRVESRVERIFGGIAAEQWDPPSRCTCWVCRRPIEEVRSYEAWWWRKQAEKERAVDSGATPLPPGKRISRSRR